MFTFKRLFVTLSLAVLTVVASAQIPAQFKFMGIPVDGSKVQMIRQLKLKGFTYDSKDDVLIGRFNGMESNVMISENYGKVDRVCIIDAHGEEEAQIKIRYNNLIRQFKDNDKYLEIEKNQPISDDEDISYEMSVHNKTYDASFYFNPMYGWTDEDKLKIAESLMAEAGVQIEFDENEDLFEEKIAQFLQVGAQRLIGMVEGQVWFRIVKRYGDYYIAMYYDNLNNRPNGEDL